MSALDEMAYSAPPTIDSRRLSAKGAADSVCHFPALRAATCRGMPFEELIPRSFTTISIRAYAPSLLRVFRISNAREMDYDCRVGQ